ncbi:hypothetical protein HN680_04575 [Candidatus Peregrinibacteria bacterium]|nr:hypothetical protein [Candidatus Peregrinibacteria bacterium]
MEGKGQEQHNEAILASMRQEMMGMYGRDDLGEREQTEFLRIVEGLACFLFKAGLQSIKDYNPERDLARVCNSLKEEEIDLFMDLLDRLEYLVTRGEVLEVLEADVREWSFAAEYDREFLLKSFFQHQGTVYSSSSHKTKDAKFEFYKNNGDSYFKRENSMIVNHVVIGGRVFSKVFSYDGKYFVADQNGELINGPFKEISSFFDIEGDLYYWANEKGENEASLYKEGERIGEYEIERPEPPVIFDGKLYICDGFEIICVDDGEVLSESSELGIQKMQRYKETLIFVETDDESGDKAIYDLHGKRHSLYYDQIKEVVVVGDAIYYSYTKNGRDNFYSPELSGNVVDYPSVNKIYSLNGKVYFECVVDDRGMKVLIDEKGEVVHSMEYALLEPPRMLGGRAVFPLSVETGSKEICLRGESKIVFSVLGELGAEVVEGFHAFIFTDDHFFMHAELDSTAIIYSPAGEKVFEEEGEIVSVEWLGGNMLSVVFGNKEKVEKKIVNF